MPAAKKKGPTRQKKTLRILQMPARSVKRTGKRRNSKKNVYTTTRKVKMRKYKRN